MKEREYKWLLTKYEALFINEFISRLVITDEKVCTYQLLL